jgi:hypothetical protein
MKQGDNTSKGDKDYNDFLFLFFTRRFQLFFVSKMSVKKRLVKTLQRQFKKELQKLKEDQKKLKEQQKFANILPL